MRVSHFTKNGDFFSFKTFTLFVKGLIYRGSDNPRGLCDSCYVIHVMNMKPSKSTVSCVWYSFVHVVRSED